MKLRDNTTRNDQTRPQILVSLRALVGQNIIKRTMTFHKILTHFLSCGFAPVARLRFRPFARASVVVPGEYEPAIIDEADFSDCRALQREESNLNNNNSNHNNLLSMVLSGISTKGVALNF